MAPTTSLTQLASAAEAAYATFLNDQQTVEADQAKLTADTQTAASDGAAAYQAVSALDQALQQILPTLPQPTAPIPTTGS
jgi:hypothetical protein